LEPIFREASKRIDICFNSQDTLMVAQWVYDQLQNLNAESGKGQGKGKGEGEGQEPGQGEGEGQGQGQGEGSSKAAKGSPSDEQGQGKGKVAGNDKKAGKARSPVHKNGRTFEPREVEPTVSAPVGAEGSGGSFDRKAGTRKEGFHSSSTDAVWTIQAGVAGKLRYEVRRLFEDSGLDEFQPHRKTGSLDSKSLTKVATGSSRLFKRRMEVEGIDSAVVIVLDVSGSMTEQGNVKISAAVQTCAALLETLAAAGVATAVLTFDNYTSVLKPFNTHYKKTLPLLQRVRCNGSTNDYFAIKIAHEMLLQRGEARKVVFVLTDGDGNVAQAKAQVASGVKLGLTTIGIGMMHNVKRVYPNNVTVADISQLGAASFKQIKLAV
jgi:cobalamin biosynthesis protein CobT